MATLLDINTGGDIDYFQSGVAQSITTTGIWRVSSIYVANIWGDAGGACTCVIRADNTGPDSILYTCKAPVTTTAVAAPATFLFDNVHLEDATVYWVAFNVPLDRTHINQATPSQYSGGQAAWTAEDVPSGPGDWTLTAIYDFERLLIGGSIGTMSGHRGFTTRSALMHRR